MRFLILVCFICLGTVSSAQAADDTDKRNMANNLLHCYTALAYWHQQFPPDDSPTLANLESSLEAFAGAATALYLMSGLTEELAQERVELVLEKNWVEVQLFDRSQWTNTIFYCGSKLSSAKKLDEAASE